ncbi:MAG: DUF4990 domain-containing protein [Prevotella sp.]|nr:DUF4990 domain-containing protein [Candidatus Equicola faecalis]
MKIRKCVFGKTNVFLLLFLLMGWTEAGAKTYYCSPTGGGAGDSYSTPCSFTSGISKLVAGDTLFCLGGQYDLKSTVSFTKNGTAQKKVCIYNYPGEKPIFDFRKMAYGSRGIQVKEGSNYVHIKGLTIRYTGKNGLHNSGSHCTFEQLDVYGNGDTGIQMKAGGDNTIINCDSHDNFDYQLANDFGGNADGFADKQYTGGTNTYINCRAWNNSDDGWDLYERVSQSGTEIVMKNCICYHNGPTEYDMRNHPRYDTDKSWFDQFAGEGKYVTFRNGTTIRVTLEHYHNNGNANGFKMGGNKTVCNVRALQCLAVANNGKGFDHNNNYGQMVIYNASAYANNQDFGYNNDGGGKLTVRNSISLNSRNANTFKCKETDVMNNSWDIAGLKCDESDFVTLDTTLICSPRMDDGSLPLLPFMRLTETSDLRDKGVGVGLPFSGKAPDLGCYEYEDVTAVRGVEHMPMADDDKMYNIMGIAIPATSASHGIFIYRGKKIRR